MSRKMLSIVFLAFLVAGSVEARPLALSLDTQPGRLAAFQQLWARAGSGLAAIFRKDGSAADPNGLKRQAVRPAPSPGPGTRLPKPAV
jgi:hypothetical protein